MNLKRFHKQPFQDSTTQNSAMDLHFIAVMIFYVTKCEAQGLNLVNYFISYNCFHISLPYFLLKFFYLWICLFTYVDFKRRVALTNYYLLIGRVQSMILLSVFFVFSMFNLFRIFENELNATILNMGCLDFFFFFFLHYSISPTGLDLLPSLVLEEFKKIVLIILALLQEKHVALD